MSEPRPASGGTVGSVVELVKHINLGGLPAVAWTLVICVALWKQDGTTLKWLWPDLFWIWKILIGIWAAYTALAEIIAYVRRRSELVPVVAEPGPRIAPAPERAVND